MAETPEVTIRSRMRTKKGMEWASRLKASEAYYRANSHDWEINRKLYADAAANKKLWRSNVAFAWATINNLVGDTMPQLPQPWIVPKRGEYRELSLMLSDLAKTMHQISETGDKMSRGRIMCAYAGYAVHWGSFDQEDVPLFMALDGDVTSDVDRAVKDENGEPIPIETTDGQARAAISQEWNGELVAPHDIRFDPEAREWDLSDDRWIARIYTRSLKDCLEDEDFDPQARRWLKDFVTQQDAERHGTNRPNYNYREGHDEKDEGFISIDIYEIWDRVNREIIHLPVGAMFPLMEADWEDPWLSTGDFPATFIAFSWDPPDENKKKGRYPVPDIRLIRDDLEKILWLESLYIDAVVGKVKKIIGPDGLFDTKAQKKFFSDKDKEWIGYNPTDVAKLLRPLTGGDLSKPLLPKEWLHIFNPAEKEELETYLVAIRHHQDNIYQVTGIGPGDRGGVSEAESATEALQIAEGLRLRKETQTRQAAKIIDRITEKMLLLLKEYQTLPLPYLKSSEYADEETWAEFTGEDLEQIRDLDLIVTHKSGSERPLTKAAYRQQAKEVLTLVMEVLQGGTPSEEMRFVIRELLATFEIPGLQKVFESPLPQLAIEAATLMQQIDQIDQELSQEQWKALSSDFMAAVAALINAALPAGGEEEVARRSIGAPEEAQATGGGSLRRSRSTGQEAAQRSAAMAGQVGGLN